jgi:hypothetical protein
VADEEKVPAPGGEETESPATALATAKAAQAKAEREKAELEKALKEKLSTESIKLIGGLVALGSGLIILALIAGGAIVAGTTVAEKIGLGAFGVIGTLVGAYFGQKVGSDGTKEATKLAETEGKKAHEEAAKAQVYASYLAHPPAADVQAVVRFAEEVAAGQKPPPGASI